jgi:hypothetical protein
MGSVAKTISNLIPNEITNTLDKIIPNEIKPALPFAAAAFPFLAPELFAGLGSLGGIIENPLAQRAIAGGITNLGSQTSQEGYDKRGINPMSLGLGTLGGALTTPSSDLNSLMATGIPYNPAGVGSQTGFYPGSATYPGTLDLSNISTPTLGGYSLTPNALDAASANIVNNLGTDYSALDKIQNATVGGAKSASDYFNKGVTGLENEGILNKDFLKAYAPGAIGAASDLAYNAAKDKALEYEKQQAAMGQTVTANKQNQINYIRKAMVSAGFTSSEIDDALKRSGFAKGGRVGYESGTMPKFIPMDLESVGLRLFGKNLDNLTYTEKQAVRDHIDDNKPKKARGGLMSLKGHEMDFRDGGGFVPIGKKERADDVPARLSKNEFVFTAKAVRNAGHGSTKEGAKRMYQLMKHLEAK